MTLRLAAKDFQRHLNETANKPVRRTIGLDHASHFRLFLTVVYRVRNCMILGTMVHLTDNT